MFHQPRQLAEALDLKAELGHDLTPLAGGTDLLVALNRGQWRPRGILDLKQVAGYDEISPDDGTYLLAAGATYSQLSRLPVAVMAAAARSIGGVQIRNRATIGGNLGTASPAGDGCVALLALDATIEPAHATRGRREVPAREFFLEYRRTALQPDELITRIRIPADWTSAWYKIGKRSSVNISIVSAGIGRSPEGRFCIAFGCLGPCPMRATRTEELLTSRPLTPRLIAEAAELVTSEVNPISDHRASAAYRRAMAAVLLRRLLTESFLPSTDGT